MPKKTGIKSGEIQRLQRFIAESELSIVEIATKTNTSSRTIQNSIYENAPLSGKFAKNLHLELGVSADWLFSGIGRMWIADQQQKEQAKENSTINHSSQRTERIVQFIRQFMTYASEDEQAWLETELRLKVRQFEKYLKDNVQT